MLGIRIRNWNRIRNFLGILDPDSLVRCTDPRIRIRTKMSRIPNTVLNPLGISDGGSSEVNAADPGLPQAARQHHSPPAIRQGSFSLCFSLVSFCDFCEWVSIYRFFVYFFWRARVCGPLLCFCRPFCIFEMCGFEPRELPYSKQAHYHLSHPCPYLATHLPAISQPSPKNLNFISRPFTVRSSKIFKSF